MGKARLEEQARSLDLKLFGELTLRVCTYSSDVLNIGASHGCAKRAREPAVACSKPTSSFLACSKAGVRETLQLCQYTRYQPRAGTEKLHERTVLFRGDGGLREHRK